MEVSSDSFYGANKDLASKLGNLTLLTQIQSILLLDPDLHVVYTLGQFGVWNMKVYYKGGKKRIKAKNSTCIRKSSEFILHAAHPVDRSGLLI